MKTLYLSDLDGTLLRSDERCSAYTAEVINRFVGAGGLFSFATARSLVTTKKVTAGLNISFPFVSHNGAIIFAGDTGEVLFMDSFSDDEISFISKTLTELKVYPTVYSFVGSVERFSYIPRFLTPEASAFLDTRKGDPRRHEAESLEELYSGEVFNVFCKGTSELLSPVNDIFSSDSRFTSLYQKDIYSEAQFCELLPIRVSKARAASWLKDMLGCDKLVVFGDGINDLPLFMAADECYAMANAVPELKEIATAVIGSNNDDGVARWIEQNAAAR